MPNIAHWDAKPVNWYIRPVQADPAITVAIPQPNHPSYPSGHSCVTTDCRDAGGRRKAGVTHPLASSSTREQMKLGAGRAQDAGPSFKKMLDTSVYHGDAEAGQVIGR